MKNNKLIDAMNDIKDEYILEARQENKKPSFHIPVKKVIILAACFVLCVSFLPKMFFGGKSTSTDQAYFETMNSSEGYHQENDYDYKVSDEASERKEIINGDIDISCKDIEEAMELIDQKMKSFGAYVQYSGFDNYTYGYRSSRMVVRVPRENYDAFVSDLKDSFDLVSYSQNLQDVTEQYRDISSRLNSLKVEEERILSLYEQAENLEEVLQLEDKLSSLRYEIEAFETQIKNYDLLTTYATLDISLKEKLPVKESASLFSRIVSSFSEGWSDLGGSAGSFLVSLSYAAPFLLIFGIIIFVVIKIIKKKRNKKKQ